MKIVNFAREQRQITRKVASSSFFFDNTYKPFILQFCTIIPNPRLRPYYAKSRNMVEYLVNAFENKKKSLVSFAAVFWMSRNAPPKSERCVTSKEKSHAWL